MEGVEQSKRTEPSCAIAILSFHDAVEHFLLLCAEKTGARKDEHHGFMKYWKIVKKASNKQLSHQIEMDRLNRTRNNLKHSGILPDMIHVEEFRDAVKSFFESNTKLFFNTDFNDINVDEHKTISPAVSKTVVTLPETVKEKSPVRSFYAQIIKSQASRPIYLDYLIAGYVSGAIAAFCLLFLPYLMNERFGFLDLLTWASLAPVLIVATYLDPVNNPLASYTGFLANDSFSLIYFTFTSVVFSAVLIYVWYLSREAEKERKDYYPQLLRNILEQNQYIEIKELAEQLNDPVKVIDVWLDMISPKYRIKREKRHIETTRRSISDVELEDLFKKLHDARVEVNELEKNQK